MNQRCEKLASVQSAFHRMNWSIFAVQEPQLNALKADLQRWSEKHLRTMSDTHRLTLSHFARFPQLLTHISIRVIVSACFAHTHTETNTLLQTTAHWLMPIRRPTEQKNTGGELRETAYLQLTYSRSVCFTLSFNRCCNQHDRSHRLSVPRRTDLISKNSSLPLSINR